VGCSGGWASNSSSVPHVWYVDGWTITSTILYHDDIFYCDTGDIQVSSIDNIYNKMEADIEQRIGDTWCDSSCHFQYKDEFTETRTVSSISNDLPDVLSQELITSVDVDGNIILEGINYKVDRVFCYWCNYVTNYDLETHGYGYSTSVVTISDVYDTGVDYNVSQDFIGEINTNVTFPNEKFYLIISPEEGGTVSIRGTVGEDVGNNIKITNLPENIPYQIKKSSKVISTGVTSNAGIIDIPSLNVEDGDETDGAYLHLFPDSLVYRGDFSTVILDNVNGESIHIDSEEDLVYVVHAYALMPTVGDVSVSNFALTSDEGDYLPLDYLNKNYTNSEDINAPVIPNYDTINFDVDEISISLSYSSILGGTGINIIETSSSTIDNVDYSSRILFGEATVGTTSYIIATTDGTVNAILSETISGTVDISNTYYLEEIPPPPPPPTRRDPLDGWVDIYINGEFDKQVWLGTDDNPAFTTSGTQSGNTAFQSVSYSYSDFLVSGSVSVDVESGDFVEFYMYAKIHGDIDSYSVPAGYTLVGETGTSTATVNILQGSILTSE